MLLLKTIVMLLFLFYILVTIANSTIKIVETKFFISSLTCHTIKLLIKKVKKGHMGERTIRGLGVKLNWVQILTHPL